jgi:putative nucleotidyltransferase with HDIG domain
MIAAGLTGFIIGAMQYQELVNASSIAMQCLVTCCLGAAAWFTLLSCLERPFELSTPLGLLELLDPTRPILERFAREAPGTYAHSIMVGHLAATAADSIGADSLLCRVAAQYHDIGKLSRAQFFKENQPEGQNIHDRINPSLSAIVVNSHVKDGERMAKELGLPASIRDIITQHHGTTLMRYFYFRAAEMSPARLNDPLEYQFRYSGPKPQTKEAAIMMLADSIEAASRTLNHPSPETIDALIINIINERVDDKQLDECPITIKDLAKIRETFNYVLGAMLHQRIEYPLQKSDADVKLMPSQEYDFYEDFDPANISFTKIGRFDEPVSPTPALKKAPHPSISRAKILSASRREAAGRKQGSGIKRTFHR